MSQARVVHDYVAMVEVLRDMKAELGLSNSLVDDLCGWTSGHCDKLIGPSSSKLIGAKTLMDLLWVFGAEIEIRPNLARMNEMALHWEKRREGQVNKTPNRISRATVRNAKPLVVREFGQIGGLVRGVMLSPKHRTDIARKAARVRWRGHRKRIRRRSKRGRARNPVKRTDRAATIAIALQPQQQLRNASQGALTSTDL